MPLIRFPRTGTSILAVTLALGTLGFGCERQEPTTPGPGQTENAGEDSPLAALVAKHGEPAATYTVRGEVERIPDPERAGTDFAVHHEAIHDFLNKKGDVVGMSSMSMPFALAEGVELPEGLEPGDKVRLHCAQWIDPDMLFFTYRVEQLPDDTELSFGPANPPAADATGDEDPDSPD